MSRRNGCGPAVLAHALVELGFAEPAPDLAARVYDAAPPDTPFALLGTTPWGLARRADGLGMRARQTGRTTRMQLRAACASGVAAVCVNLRPLGARLPAAHWAVVRAADDEGVDLDLLVDVGARRRRYRWDVFERAWSIPLPGYWRCLVALRPAETPRRRAAAEDARRF